MDQLNYTGINLSDTQKYQLVGISTTGVACLVQSWKNQMSNPIDGKFCQVLWDGIYCWPATLANQTVDVPCSTFFGEKVFRKESTVRAFKICSEEGVWVGGTYTNYSSCIKNMKELALQLIRDPQLASRYFTLIPRVLLGGSVVSIVCLVCTICLYTYLKSKYLDKLKILMQLMIALLLKSILWIVIVGPEISSKIRDYRKWGWTCNFVISAHFYTQLVAICWALVLGHYLLGRLNSVQSCIEFLKLRYMSFCWGIPGLIISLWATMMALSNDTICWEYHSKSRYFWIITTPMLAAFGAELFYLVNIIRTIIRRYQNVQTRNELLRIQKAKRDVGIFSIFAGFNNVLLLCNPWGEANESYRIFQAFFQSIQGGIIALLCCFTYYRTLLKKLNRPDLSRRPESFLVQFQQNFMTERNI